MLKAIYPGSFDPITKGHLDIIERASGIVDTLVIGILENPNKKSLFTVEERKDQIRRVTKHIKNVQVVSFYGLLADFAKENDCKLMIRGLRNSSDFEIEYQRALINNRLGSDVETIFLASKAENAIISSSAVKETAAFGDNIGFMVPEEIVEEILEKYRR